jgi:hypothetical protein
VGGEEALLALDLAERRWDGAYADDVVAHHCPSPVRDRSARRVRDLRNDMWTLWLRRPLASALPETARVLARLFHEREVRAALRQALAGVHWIVRERAPVRPATERALRRLEETP